MRVIKIKRVFLVVAAIFFAVLICPNKILAQSYDYEKIKVDIKINKDGTFNAAEDMTLNLDGNFGFFYRDISLKDIDYIDEIKVYDGDGRELDKSEYEISNSLGKKKVQWNFLRRDFSSEQKSWTLEYKVHGGLGFYKDHDELYWNAIFPDRDVLVKNAEVFVYLPEAQDINKMTAVIYSQKNLSGFTAKVLNSREYYFKANNLNPYTDFTIAAGWTKGIFNYNNIFLSYWLSLDRLLAFLLPIVAFILMYILWRKKGRDPKINKTIIAEYAPPDDLGPAEVEVLLKTSAGMKGISATIIDLAVRGYLKIYETDKKWWEPKKDYEFEIIKSDWRIDKNLRDYEKRLLEEMLEAKREKNMEWANIKGNILLKSLGKIVDEIGADKYIKENRISAKELRNGMFSVKCRKIFDLVYESVTKKGEFTKNPKNSKFLFIIVGVMIILWPIFFFGFLQTFGMGWISLGLIISGIIIIIFGNLMPQKTFEGANDRYKWLCFKEYLSVAEKFRLEASTLENFEKYLPYAMVMGVEKKWGERFDMVRDQMDSPSWYIAAGSSSSFMSGNSFSPTGFSKSMSSMVSSFVSSSGGGGAGGGGFSGGGGGGGGGGAG